MNTISTPALVDAFGATKAAAAQIAEDLDGIKNELIAREGEGKFEGDVFRLALSHSLRATVDKDAIIRTLAKAAGYTDKRLDNLIAAHTTQSPSWVARCSARSTK